MITDNGLNYNYLMTASDLDVASAEEEFGSAADDAEWAEKVLSVTVKGKKHYI